jgi:dihydrofolate synthase/folylpolyglutamate synthase
MQYREATRFLYELAPRGIKLDLGRMTEALARRGNPHEKLRYVHVAGTNGKGSTSAMIASILKAAGFRTGLYTSPHLHRFVERIRIDGRPIGERAAAKVITAIARAMEEPGFPELTFFEVATLVAFEVFRDAKVDLVVLEVGLGGRLDATNVVTPLVSAITRIAMDHTDMLGETIEEIAAEKAGIIKPGVPVVSSVRGEEARAVVDARAAEVSAPCYLIDRDIKIHPSRRRGRFELSCGERTFEALAVGLAGGHQVDNAACAVAAVCALEHAGLDVDEESIRKGLRNVKWPGRLERIGKAPSVLLDVAHNADGCAALASYVSARGRKRRVLLFGAMNDKDVPGMLDALESVFDARFYVQPDLPRALDPHRIEAILPGTVAPSVLDGFRMAKEAAGPDGEVVVTGSLFVVAPVRAEILGVRSEPLVRG